MRRIALLGAAGSLLLLAAGLVYSPVPVNSWLLHLDVLADLRAGSDRLPLGLTLAALGLVLLTLAWWLLYRTVPGRAGSVRAVRIVTALWVAPLLLAPPLFSGDGWSYAANGYLAGHGASPYDVPTAVLGPALRSAVSHRWWFTPSPYGPLALGWGGLFSHLTANPWLLLFAYRALAVGGLVLLGWAVPRLAVRTGRDPAAASAFVVASPLVIAHGIGGLHLDLATAGLMLAALVATRRDVWLTGAVLAGLAASVKATGGLVAVGVVLLSLAPVTDLVPRVRRIAGVAAVSCGTLFATGLVTGLGAGWLRGLAVPAGIRPPDTPSVLTGHVVAWLLLAGGNVSASFAHAFPRTVLPAVGVALFVGVLGWVLARGRPRDTGAALGAVAVVLVAMTELSPVVHFWYFLWCLPLVGCLRLERWQAAAATTAMVVLGLTALADPALRVAWLTWLGAGAVVLLPPLVGLSEWLRTRASGPRQGRDQVATVG